MHATLPITGTTPTAHIRRGLRRLIQKISLMAGWKTEQGTALFPPYFPMLRTSPMTLRSMEKITTPHTPQISLMAGREREQGTAPLPLYHIPVMPSEIEHHMQPAHGKLIKIGLA